MGTNGINKLPVLKSEFLIDSAITYLNFGSFGACPKQVFENYIKWQYELEKEPVQFITRNGINYLQESKDALSQYLNCSAEDLIFTPNPSHAVNLVAKNLELKPDDEILTTNLEYGACDKTWQFYCNKSGAKYIRQKIELPLQSKQKFIDDFFKGFSSKTKLVFISHITSATGLVFPVEEICAIAKQRGVMTFVDGAHAPGQVAIDLKKLPADFYTGACHKWMLAPKGCSFLYVKREFQKMLDPLIVSWGYDGTEPSSSTFQQFHQFNGTRDFSAYLTLPAAIDFMQRNNWKEYSKICRELVLSNAQRFCDLLGSTPICPISEEFLAQLYSIRITTSNPEKLQRCLYETYHIEIPLIQINNEVYIRFSIQVFNSQKELDRLYDALSDIIKTTELIEIKGN
ncbi:MAG TPA: aminotransferase class V-fold PLP-dependent enzyme [Bacteroidia bacterium]|nr:aminotransferase class V-fold PLP-dependent enzyme [Bacteroidia bacterium]HRH07482.1 aminotransferase class V-fold PLP-dependent enzyme [Bacteroidia bacterium]HRH62121.1 aminotransferase class V-fold PLP-dependent enzyme [Bacteroidia bacterium]